MGQRWVLHPFLFAVFPIVALYAHNVYETPPGEIVQPIEIMLGVTLLVWLALKGLVRNGQRAGFIATLALFVFFTVASASTTVNETLTYLSTFWIATKYDLEPARVIWPQVLICTALGVLLVFRPKDPRRLTSYLNILAAILVTLPASQAAFQLAWDPVGPMKWAPILQTGAQPPEKLPDVYLIVLDGYARSDVLKENFDFDNTPFLKHLEQKGFYIPQRSTANYCQTRLSLASILNADYLDEYVSKLGQDATLMRELIGANSVSKTFKKLGYRIVSFATGYDETDHVGRDMRLAPFTELSEFHRMLTNLTPLGDVLPDLLAARDPYDAARERTLFLLNTLPQIARYAEPTFTVAHVVAPHPPFIFGENGEDISPRKMKYLLCDASSFDSHYGAENYREGYRRQAIFVTRQIERVIDQILENSPEPPIIILQSDHGSGMNLDAQDVKKSDMHERMGILNAYLFPDRDYHRLSETITPVNTFRVVLNQFFGAQLEMLPEKNYYSTWTSPFDFIEVTDRVRERKPGAVAEAPGGSPTASPGPHSPLSYRAGDLRPTNPG
jgi:hypothetical protein